MDNEDRCLYSWSGTDPNGTPAWCNGWIRDNPDATDETITRNSPTFPYVPSVDVFRCPSDKSVFPFGDFRKGETKRRIRSYSQNGFIGYPGTYVTPNMSSVQVRPQAERHHQPRAFLDLRVRGRTHELHQRLPLPALQGFESVSTDQPWLDMPTGRHGNAAGIAYADGHAEIHRWLDSTVTQEKAEIPPLIRRRPQRPRRAAGPRDFTWFTNHVASRQ